MLSVKGDPDTWRHSCRYATITTYHDHNTSASVAGEDVDFEGYASAFTGHWLVVYPVSSQETLAEQALHALLHHTVVSLDDHAQPLRDDQQAIMHKRIYDCPVGYQPRDMPCVTSRGFIGDDSDHMPPGQVSVVSVVQGGNSGVGVILGRALCQSVRSGLLLLVSCPPVPSLGPQSTCMFY